MEEIKENKSTVTTYRVKEDTKADIKKQIEQMGLTQEKYFEKVVSIMELENVKQNSFLSKDTTIIESNLKAILNSFISIAESSNNLISNKDAELEELKIKYKDMLSIKEIKITEQRVELQSVYAQLNVLQSQVSKNKADMDELKNEHSKQLEQLEGNLKDKNSIIEEYRGKNDMLLNQLKEFEQYPSQLKEAQLNINSLKDILKDSEIEVINLKNELNNKQTCITEQTLELQGVYNELDILQNEINKHKNELTDSKTEIINMKNDLKNKDNEIDSLTNSIQLNEAKYAHDIKEKNEIHSKEIFELNTKHSNELEETTSKLQLEIENLKNTHKTSIDQLQDKLKFDKDKEILKLEKDHQKAIKELEKQSQKEIAQYQNKYKELLEKLEQKEADLKESEVLKKENKEE